MWRRLWRAFGFAILGALAAASVAAAVLTVASFPSAYSVFYRHRIDEVPHDTWTYVARGKMWIGRMQVGPRGLLPPPPTSWRFQRTPPSPVVYERPLVRRFDTGFGYTPRDVVSNQMYGIVVPVWFLAIVLGVAPAWWIVRMMRGRRRFAANCCTTCGYDLRATPERCPECGTVVQPAAAPPPASAPPAPPAPSHAARV